MKYIGAVFLLLMIPFALAEPVKLWEYSDQCAAFSMSFNHDGYVGLAFGYYAELLSPGGEALLKAPTRGIAYSSSLSDNNVLLIGTEGDWVQAFSKQGKLLWERKLRNAVVSVSISSNGSIALAGDASGYVYLFRNGELKWDRNLGKYVWSVALDGNLVLAGSDRGVYAFDFNGRTLWSRTFNGAARKVMPAGDGVAVLVVPKNESWSELVLLSKKGSILWSRHFSGYIRSISTDERHIAIAGTTGNVTLFSASGNVVYSVPLISYANDVATFEGYTAVAYGRNAELIAPNGSVVWFERFNGTVYHVGFSPTGYFAVDYGSHDVQNCYSVIVGYSLTHSDVSTERSHTVRTSPGYNPLAAGGILAGIILLGVLLWLQRKL